MLAWTLDMDTVDRGILDTENDHEIIVVASDQKAENFFWSQHFHGNNDTFLKVTN